MSKTLAILLAATALGVTYSNFKGQSLDTLKADWSKSKCDTFTNVVKKTIAPLLLIGAAAFVAVVL